MNISGPLSISGIRPPHQELDLRPFQRVTAHVLSITGTTALLSIEGHPVVAQLASADQAAALLPQQTAQFVVTGRTSQKITLKLIGEDKPQISSTLSLVQRPDVAIRLLEQHNIPVTVNHLIIARAILKQHLPITPSLLNELQEVLSIYGAWGNNEAELAAALKSAGLPLTPQSIALASRQAAQIGDSLTRLVVKLTDMAGQDVPEDLSKQLNLVLQLLNNMVLQAAEEPSQLAEQLKAAVGILGRSFENILLEQLKSPQVPIENDLLAFVRIQDQLMQAGRNEISEAVGDFIKDLQWNQFLNAKPDPIPGQGEWSELGFALQDAKQKKEEQFSPARLRIMREQQGGFSKINTAYTRLILQVDLSPGQTVEVDLSLVDKQIRTLVTAPDVTWCEQAQKKLPELARAFQALGFTLEDASINLDQPHPFERLKTSGNHFPITIDIEA